VLPLPLIQLSWENVLSKNPKETNGISSIVTKHGSKFQGLSHWICNVSSFRKNNSTRRELIANTAAQIAVELPEVCLCSALWCSCPHYLKEYIKNKWVKKEKIHFQNSVNTVKKRHNGIWVGAYAFTWKKSKARLFFCSDIFAHLFWSGQGTLGHWCCLSSSFPRKRLRGGKIRTFYSKQNPIKGVSWKKRYLWETCQ